MGLDTVRQRNEVIYECAREAERHEAHLLACGEMERAREAGCIARAIRKMIVKPKD